MRDALGAVQSVLVLGGTSEIALATVASARRRRAAGPSSLAVREPVAAAATVDGPARRRRHHGRGRRLRRPRHRPPTEASSTTSFDRFGDIDLVARSPSACSATRPTSTPIPSPRPTRPRGQLRRRGQRRPRRRRTPSAARATARSSCSPRSPAIRARKSNFVYGSTKAGLDAFAQGLGDALVGTGGRVMVVRPGLRAHPDDRGHGRRAVRHRRPTPSPTPIVAGLQRNREIVWAPALLRCVFARHARPPPPVWRIVSAR